MDNNKNSPVLNKHIGLIHCEGRLTLLQRKICNILLFNALSEINTKEIFELGLKQLCSLIGYKSNDIALIKKSLTTLISLVLEWNLLDQKKLQEDNSEQILNKKANIAWHASSLLAGVSIENGIISYSYSPQIKKIISSLDIYGQINLFIQAKFKSNYSLALYENCIRFKNIKQTCLFDLAVFRQLMGIESAVYNDFKELSRNVITPALKEINEKSDIALDVEFKKSGRKIIALKFFIKDNENYLPKFKRKEKRLSSGALTVKNTLLTTFKLHEKDADYIVEKFDSDYIKIKLDEIYQSNSFKNKKIYNLNAYINAILEAEYQINLAAKTTSATTTEQTESKTFNTHYTKYKTTVLLQSFDKQESTVKDTVVNAYKAALQLESSVLFQLFLRKSFNSPIIATHFLAYIQTHHPSLLPAFLAYEEFITAEV